MVRVSGGGYRDVVYLGKHLSASVLLTLGLESSLLWGGAVLCIVGWLAASLVLGARSSLLLPASLSCDNQQCLQLLPHFP